jgi:hypothetical protein
MQVAKLITTSVTGIALAFSMLASTLPANAATAGFHAAYFSESDFLARSPGQTGQFAVGYTNTGDQAWVKGAANQQANLATAAPLDNTTDFTAGWANGWLSANRYAAQDASLVAPGQIGFFIYNFTVPANAAAGEHRFYGRPVIDGVTYMEDYGYYQSAVVTAGSVLINSTTPASPSTVNQPVVNGTGATASSTVTIKDGTTTVGTGTADSNGAFAITTSVLAEGCHTLTASSTGPTSGQSAASGNTATYCVDRTAPTVSSVTAPNGKTIVVTYSEAVNSSKTAASGAANPANYTLDGAALPALSTISASTDKTTYTITLGGAGMASPSGHTLGVSNVADLAGNTMTAQSVAFTVNDTTGPAISSATANAAPGGTTTSVTVTWNEPVQCVGAYSVDGVTAAAAAGSTASSCTITSQALTQGTTHTLTATNEKDAVGNTESPNPQSASFTVGTASATITANSATATETAGQVVFSTTVNPAPTGTYTVQTANGTVVPHGAVARDGTNTSAVNIPFTTSPFAVVGGGCTTATTCALTITVTGETGAASETQSPPSQVLSATATKDTTGPTLSGVTQSGTTQTLFDVVWSENVSAPQACNTTTTCPIRIKSGSTIIASTVVGEGTTANLVASDNTAGDNLTRLTASAAIPGGAYTLTAGAGVVNDLSPQANASAAGSIPMSVTDTTRPTVVSMTPNTTATCAGTACRTITITYSEKMATSGAGSVIDLSHYTLNGSAMSGTASVDATGTIVTITLTSTPPVGANQVAITGVTDTSGNLINPNPTLQNFTRTS